MILLIPVKALIIFLIILQSHEIFPASVQEEIVKKREQCVRDIKVYFEGDNIYEHGRIAIMKYTQYQGTTPLNAASKGYYKSFEKFIGPGHVQSPQAYCSSGKSEDCLKWLKRVFGPYKLDTLKAVLNAFYNFRFFDLENLNLVYPYIPEENQLELIDYFILIRDNYGLQTTYFKNPGMFCSFEYPLPETPETEGETSIQEK